MSLGPYTLLRITERGVVLYDQHQRRLASGGRPFLDQFAAFARTATPGIYAISRDENSLHVTERGPSRLWDGMPVRSLASPFQHRGGRFPKPSPPSVYDDLRVPGLCTLLTSVDGEEIYESCSAAVLSWDGTRLILPPSDRPAVDSTAEQALRAVIPFRETPILMRGNQPLALVNAIRGICLPKIPDRLPFPRRGIKRIAEALEASTRRP